MMKPTVVIIKILKEVSTSRFMELYLLHLASSPDDGQKVTFQDCHVGKQNTKTIKKE